MELWKFYVSGNCEFVLLGAIIDELSFSFSAIFRVETSVHRHDKPNDLIDFCSRSFVFFHLLFFNLLRHASSRIFFFFL